MKTSPGSSCEVLPDPHYSADNARHSADDAPHSADNARHSADDGSLSDTSLVHISASSSFEMVPPQETNPVIPDTSSNIDFEGLEEDLSGDELPEEVEEDETILENEGQDEGPSFDPSRYTIEDFTAEIAYQEYQVLILTCTIIISYLQVAIKYLIASCHYIKVF